MPSQIPPTLFVSHGAPTLVTDDSPTRRFLAGWGQALGRPDAIVVFSAHYETAITTVSAGARPAMIYDFGGFPAKLYEIVYPAPGDPGLAADIAGLLQAGGLTVEQDDSRGYDHGTWVPLALMYPDAGLPVVQVSLSPRLGPRYHHELGRLLAPLRERGILFIGSGSATHNLRHYFRGSAGDPTPDWAAAFNEWLADRVHAGDTDALIEYRERAPFAAENHPTEEHYLPLLCALGAAHSRPAGRRVHQDYEHGVLSMDAYEFGVRR